MQRFLRNTDSSGWSQTRTSTRGSSTATEWRSSPRGTRCLPSGIRCSRPRKWRRGSGYGRRRRPFGWRRSGWNASGPRRSRGGLKRKREYGKRRRRNAALKKKRRKAERRNWRRSRSGRENEKRRLSRRRKSEKKRSGRSGSSLPKSDERKAAFAMKDIAPPVGAIESSSNRLRKADHGVIGRNPSRQCAKTSTNRPPIAKRDSPGRVAMVCAKTGTLRRLIVG
mmetsp:Transcript_33593/g.54426  ORF Transcript_33593/g.54426 Transcript_33593/m.54426 type:complete len:224 (+) Transcript_33593:2246-2917(+)